MGFQVPSGDVIPVPVKWMVDTEYSELVLADNKGPYTTGVPYNFDNQGSPYEFLVYFCPDTGLQK